MRFCAYCESVRERSHLPAIHLTPVLCLTTLLLLAAAAASPPTLAMYGVALRFFALRLKPPS